LATPITGSGAQKAEKYLAEKSYSWRIDPYFSAEHFSA
jgi:hypothetical protein